MLQSVNLKRLAEAVCQVTDVTLTEFQGSKKSGKLNLSRGIFAMMARWFEIHPSDIGAFLSRSRSSCINTAKHYQGYYDVGDKCIHSTTLKIEEILRYER